MNPRSLMTHIRAFAPNTPQPVRYRPTVELKFVAGKLHQKWVSDCGMQHEWRMVPRED